MRIKNVYLFNNGKGGLSLPFGADVEIDGLVAAQNGGPGIEVRDAPPVISEVPTPDLVQALETYRAAAPTTREHAAEVLGKAGLLKWPTAFGSVLSWVLAHPDKLGAWIDMLRRELAK